MYLKAIYSRSDFSHLITWLETQDGFLLPLDPISNQMISHLQSRIQMHNILKPYCTKIPGIILIGFDKEQALPWKLFYCRDPVSTGFQLTSVWYFKVQKIWTITRCTDNCKIRNAATKITQKIRQNERSSKMTLKIKNM